MNPTIPVSQKQTGCLICKGALGKSPGPLCDECRRKAEDRIERKKKVYRREVPADDELTEGAYRLSDLEKVIQQDNQKIQQQAKNRAAKAAVQQPQKGGEE